MYNVNIITVVKCSYSLIKVKLMECSGVKRTVSSDERFVESDARKEQWIYTVAPVITGKSGISHEFDFAFTKADENGDIITCSIIPSNAKDTLSLITFFNAHSEDVNAYRKFLFFERPPNIEERLLTNSLRIEIIMVKKEQSTRIYASLIKPSATGASRLQGNPSTARFLNEKTRHNKKKYRDRTGLLYEVLSSVSYNHGSSLSTIIYRCNLNYNSAKSIISELLEKELLAVVKNEEEKDTYHVTEHGWGFLERLSFYKQTKILE